MALRSDEELVGAVDSARPVVVVAGPSSALTVPGLMVAEVTSSLARVAWVECVDVDLGTHYAAGLNRAPSLAAAHSRSQFSGVIHHRAPGAPRMRARAFREWLPSGLDLAVAFMWPGLDTSWIPQLATVAMSVGAETTALWVSLPNRAAVDMTSLARDVAGFDRVVTGTPEDAQALQGILRGRGPVVDVEPALSLRGRQDHAGPYRITAFLPRNDVRSLATVLDAFDAIPESWVDDYELTVLMRSKDDVPRQLIASSFHTKKVRLEGGTLSESRLRELCAASSALVLADPGLDSRVYSIAVGCGVATVVLAPTDVPPVGHGYVGGLLADVGHPASLLSALMHALRLSELQFPKPESWDELSWRLLHLTAVGPAGPKRRSMSRTR
ncbi:MAG: hypothetical protein ACHQFZ_08300 [Acidimicrobiales bacterium]